MNNLNRTATIGLIFVSIGLILILDNFNIIPWGFRFYLFQWENILIALGAVFLITRQNQRVGIILLVLGVAFSLDEWFRYRFDIWDLWPVVFIVIGIYIINRDKEAKAFDPNSAEDHNDLIDDVAIFGGSDKVINSMNFKGGNLTAIFGGSNIDLTTSQLAEGTHAIDVLYLFGGSKIRVPQDWDVRLNVTSIFGGLSDKRALVDTHQDQSKTLYIKGLILFGGAELTN